MFVVDLSRSLAGYNELAKTPKQQKTVQRWTVTLHLYGNSKPVKKFILTSTAVLLLTVFFPSSFLLNSCSQTKKLVDPNGFLYVPTNKFLSQTEITNKEYSQFLNALIAKGEKELLEKARIDSLKWKKAIINCDSLVKEYQTEKYNDYPVVNISYEATTLYCEWLTEKYNKDPKRSYKKLLFRLPTEKEWEDFARGGMKDYIFPFGYSLQNKYFQYSCNFAVVAQHSIKLDSSRQHLSFHYDSLGNIQLENKTGIKSVWSYSPNEYGLYNCSGNVSEMVQEKGIAKGGSWASPGYYMKITSREYYSEASCTIGFRVLSEIIEK